jgi:hypothetical protein
MSEESTVQTRAGIDPALLAAHPELAVLALDLPDSDGEPMENERERFQMLLLLDVLEQYWHDRQDYYAGGNMFVYYSVQQARQILAEEAEPARPRRAFRGPTCSWCGMWMAAFGGRSGWYGKRAAGILT